MGPMGGADGLEPHTETVNRLHQILVICSIKAVTTSMISFTEQKKTLYLSFAPRKYPKSPQCDVGKKTAKTRMNTEILASSKEDPNRREMRGYRARRRF